MAYRVLLVDDEPDILEFVGYNLRKEGYEVYLAANGEQAVEVAREVIPHLVLLDIMMPGTDGLTACRKMRSVRELEGTVIAFLTARGEDISQIEGFEAGGDDYITKPIRMNVLKSRIKALLKRSDEDAAQSQQALQIDHERHLIQCDGREIVLPRKEFKLLALLCSSPGRVFTREEIYTHVWGDDVIVGERTIDVHIRKLREKIAGEHIITLKGVGYKYEP